MADRYTDLPLIGIFVAVVWTGADAVGADLLQFAGFQELFDQLLVGFGHRLHQLGAPLGGLIGHGGGDPGVSALLVHHLAAGTTIITLCNQDRGSWAATMELTRALGLHDPRDSSA